MKAGRILVSVHLVIEHESFTVQTLEAKTLRNYITIIHPTISSVNGLLVLGFKVNLRRKSEGDCKDGLKDPQKSSQQSGSNYLVGSNY